LVDHLRPPYCCIQVSLHVAASDRMWARLHNLATTAVSQLDQLNLTSGRSIVVSF